MCTSSTTRTHAVNCYQCDLSLSYSIAQNTSSTLLMYIRTAIINHYSITCKFTWANPTKSLSLSE